jgi:hypothetical protein
VSNINLKARKMNTEKDIKKDEQSESDLKQLLCGRKIVCIIGSSRFADINAVKMWEFAKEGTLALGMYLLPDWYWEATEKTEKGHAAEQEGVAETLDDLHLTKIRLADEVYVLNVNGYIGERTAYEIEYAKELGKPLVYHEAT